jgi:hypothetical protein
MTKLVEPWEYTHPQKEWFKQTDLNGWQQLMKSFFDGELLSTPWHGAPLADESQTLIPELHALVDAGFITTNSQPGVDTLWKLQRHQQRAWVEGFCDLQTAFQLLPLNTVPDIKVNVVVNGGTASQARFYDLPVTRHGLRTLTWHGDGFVLPVTDGLQRKDFTMGAWQEMTKWCTVSVVDVRWGENRLWELLRNALS